MINLDSEIFVRLVPEIRSSLLERELLAPCCPKSGRSLTREVFFWHKKTDFDPDERSVDIILRHVTYIQGFLLFLRTKIDVLEVPEPLWTKYWPIILPYIVAARLSARLHGRKLRVITYAIENLDAVERLSLPALDALPRVSRLVSSVLRFVWGQSLRLLDGIQFATLGAAANYNLSFPEIHGMEQNVVPTQLDRCAACDLPSIKTRPRTILFIGQLTEAKGVRDLMDAWTNVSAQVPGWILRIIGDGPLSSLIDAIVKERKDVVAEGLVVDRGRIHQALAGARVVVLPSVRVRRWREQIGLSLIEGESHGCHLVTSLESGAAEALGQRGAYLCHPGDVVSLEHALIRAMLDETDPPEHPKLSDDRRAFMCWAMHAA